MEPPCSVEFVNETDEIVAATSGWDGGQDSCESDDGVEAMVSASDGDISQVTSSGPKALPKPKPGKKTRGRVKIEMKYIKNKIRRYTTFSKRKTGIMKKAYELSVLTGTQVMLLVASETGHVYTFATRKLHPMITSENGKALIQTCLCTPDTAVLTLPADGPVPIAPQPAQQEASFPHPTSTPPSVPTATKISSGGITFDISNSDQKIASLSSTFPAAPGQPAAEESQLPLRQVRLASAVTSNFSDIRPLGAATVASRFTTSDISSPATAAAATELLLSQNPDIESTITAVDLRQQGAPSRMMVIESHASDNNNGSFGDIEAPSLQLATKPQKCFLYRVPGTNRFLPVQVESSLGLGEMSEPMAAVCTALSDQQSPVTFVNVPGATNDDQLSSGTAFVYSTAPGIMFATSSAMARSLPTDGYILNIPGTPAFAVPQEIASTHHVAGKTDQYLTIPISSHPQLLQPILTQSPAAANVGYINVNGSSLGIRCASTLLAQLPSTKDNS